MKSTIELPDDIKHRLDILAVRSNSTPSRIIEDALSHGRSLAWQEKWTSGVRAGLAEADAGEFVTEEEINVVLNKYAKV
ncbi:CopG family ribbon-helix-helix protein [Agrobacterium tumefaciens]|uniref:CopG family ribbon-helix-helix protein n=1 Tax=Agrobacterium tumefaciens TaxID=358 RepID=UPI0015740DA1|nr:CopG family ribbon-helix-helix protein [Agrobacterium tumefaciens]WCK05256.1 CopG family ribbon-helix-helix protein [Agrobacterium tumefaciens]